MNPRRAGGDFLSSGYKFLLHSMVRVMISYWNQKFADFEEQERGVDHLEQEVQQAVNTLDNYRQYFTDYMPELTKFGLKVVAAILIFIGGRKVIQWIIYLIKASMEKASVDKGVVQFICSLLKVCLYILLVFTIATHFGVKESSVAALLGTAGVTVGLALQGGLANIAGGILLLTFKPFQVGDYIIIAQQNGCEGTVYKIEICYTTLISIDNKHIVIPNGTLSSSIITNVTARDLRKLEIKVGISYDADIHKAKELLEDILHNDEDTKDDKGMVVFVDELGESAVIMGLRVWVATDKYWPAKWRLNELIKESFDANGIEIPYNQLQIHVKKQKTEA